MGSFAKKLELTLKALSMTRARLAADLAVDKSLVTRWISGAVTPSSHNLARLTEFIASKRPGFTMLDWDCDLASLAVKLGGAPPPAPDSLAGFGGWLPDPVLREAMATTGMRGDAYEGSWRSTRLSNEFPGRFMHDQIMIRRADNGFLSFRVGVGDMRFEGWTLPMQTQLFTVSADARTGVFMFAIFNAVLRERAEVLDGLTLTCQRNNGGTAVSAPCLIERTGVLSGDIAADDTLYEASIVQNPMAPEGSVPEDIRNHLFHDVGPTALARVGNAALMMSFATSLSRGPFSHISERAAGAGA